MVTERTENPNLGPLANPWDGPAGGDPMGSDPTGGAGEWRHWSNTMERLDSLNMDTPSSFMTDGVYRDDEEQTYVEGMVEVGLIMLNAPCNNRLSRMAALHRDIAERRIAAFADGVPDMEITGGFWIVADEESAERAAETVVGIRAQLQKIADTIARDKAAGTFQDFGAYRALFQEPDPQRRLNGQKFDLAPYFLQVAMSWTLASAQNTRRKFNQGLIAKLFTLGNKEPSFEEQRAMQRGSGRRRRWGGGGGDDGDDA